MSSLNLGVSLLRVTNGFPYPRLSKCLEHYYLFSNSIDIYSNSFGNGSLNFDKHFYKVGIGQAMVILIILLFHELSAKLFIQLFLYNNLVMPRHIDLHGRPIFQSLINNIICV